jgi:chaperone modulatory protein CbpM
MLEDGQECVSRDELGDMERMIRLHYELDINYAGLEAIHHLLERVREMQKELNQLRNRLGNF